jgi:hypothetical protein
MIFILLVDIHRVEVFTKFQFVVVNISQDINYWSQADFTMQVMFHKYVNISFT